MDINCQALGCMKCCQTYWISILPRDTVRLAAQRGVDPAEFLSDNCLLDLQLFPAYQHSALSIPTTAFSDSAKTAIREYFGRLPPFMLALPGLVLSRKSNGSCTFLDQKTGLCGVYDARPAQCRLFPFISLEQKPLHELYDFCKYLQEEKPSSNPFERDQSDHFAAIKAYFGEVEEQGFGHVWPDLPDKGIIRLGSRVLEKITKKQFLRLIDQYPSPEAKNTSPSI
jgi:Fe-S-cluster containining protein